MVETSVRLVSRRTSVKPRSVASLNCPGIIKRTPDYRHRRNTLPGQAGIRRVAGDHHAQS